MLTKLSTYPPQIVYKYKISDYTKLFQKDEIGDMFTALFTRNLWIMCITRWINMDMGKK